jgi:hypothetical protein
VFLARINIILDITRKSKKEMIHTTEIDINGYPAKVSILFEEEQVDFSNVKIHYVITDIVLLEDEEEYAVNGEKHIYDLMVEAILSGEANKNALEMIYREYK